MENTTNQQDGKGHDANIVLCKAGYNQALNLIEENIGVYKLNLGMARAEKDDKEKWYRMGQIHALQELRFELINSQPTVASSAVGSQTSARVEMCGSDCCPDDGQCENCQNPIRTGG